MVDVPEVLPIQTEAISISRENSSTSSTLFLILRVIVGCFIWLPMFFMMIGVIVAFGMLIAMTISGLQLLWLVFVCGGLMCIVIAIFVPLNKLVWGGLIK